MNTSVPLLDLAPKLKRPLWPWNPLDYLRLLYWVFFFPQALRWYVETFDDSKYRRTLALMGFLLAISISFLLVALVEWNHVPMSWYGIALGTIFGGIVGIGFSTGPNSMVKFTRRVVGGIAGAITGSIVGFVAELMIATKTVGMIGGIVLAVVAGTAIGLTRGAMDSVSNDKFPKVQGNTIIVSMAAGIVIGLVIGISRGGIAGGIASIVTGALTGVVIGSVFFLEVGSSITQSIFLATLGIILTIVVGAGAGAIGGIIADLVGHTTGNVGNGAMDGITLGITSWAAIIAAIVASLRPLDYLVFAPFAVLMWSREKQGYRPLCHVTPLPLPGLRRRLVSWLELDWSASLQNINQILTYSIQFVPVIQAIKVALERKSDPIAAIAELISTPYGWELIRKAYNLESFWKDDKSSLPRAASAGFWHLHDEKADEAARAFAAVRALPHGEAFYRLAMTLKRAQNIKNFSDLAALGQDKEFLQVTLPPEKEDLLHEAAWDAVNHLLHAALEALAAQRSVSRTARSLALNRALGEVSAVLKSETVLPETEQALIVTIATAWRDALLVMAREFGQTETTKPVHNPHIIGDPVIGAGLVGREDILRRLEEFWRGARNLPSVALYGHRRMGKTSILRNLNAHLGADLHLAYVNLLLLGELRGREADFLLKLADEIQRVLQENSLGIFPVEVEAFDAHPYRAFEQFLDKVRYGLRGDGLLIALDEFERLEDWIREGALPPDILDILRGYIQKYERIAFIFAGLHTLEEMNADYFQPFFATTVPVRVSFLSREAVFQLLANPPDPDFSLDYTPEALQYIWELTAGQPYLTQWIGHRLVSRYNDLTFEQGKPQEPIFQVKDVEAVITQEDFYTQARYYFAGVWGQAGQGAPGQQALLRLLASYPQGLSLEQIIATSGMSPASVRAALKELQHHDVLYEEAGQWRYTVELFRRWVTKETAE